jgi:hypothetical protein
MVAQVGYSVARRSRGRVAPCAICTVHVEMRSTSFLVETQNQGRQFVSVWPQNHWGGFSSVCASKLMPTVRKWFGLKTTRTVSHRFGPQNRW